jgi:hypothetical protein
VPLQISQVQEVSVNKIRCVELFCSLTIKCRLLSVQEAVLVLEMVIKWLFSRVIKPNSVDIPFTHLNVIMNVKYLDIMLPFKVS